jgi:very-short-patch-repair endonuclease
MRTQAGNRSVDSIIGDFADRQQGSVSARQLRAAGIGRDAIGRRVRKRLLRPIHRGVYLVGHTAAAPYAEEMAAALACGDHAVVSHRSAAAMWGFLSYPAKGDVWITVADGTDRCRPGIRIHRTRRLGPADIRRIEGVPVTSPDRTVLDIAAVVDEARLEAAVAEAHVRKLVSDASLRRQLSRDRGRPGCGAVGALLERAGEPAHTKRKAERLLLRLVRRAGLPEPRANARVGPYEVDLLWREQRVVVEFDSIRFHTNRRAFKRDRDRTNDLQLRGYVVLRITWVHLTREWSATEARIRQALT